MARHYFLTGGILLILALWALVIPARAARYQWCGSELYQVCSSGCGSGIVLAAAGDHSSSAHHSDNYETIFELYRQRKFDKAIAGLKPICEREPDNTKINFLLAKAYLEKAQELKESGDAGWRALLVDGYNIAQRHIRSSGQLYSELLYILAKSNFINDKEEGALKYIERAIKRSSFKPEHYLLLGDLYSSIAKKNLAVRKGEVEKNCEHAVKNYQIVMDAFKGAMADKSSRALAHYRLAVHYSIFGDSTKAREALETGLMLGPDELLTSHMLILLNKVQKQPNLANSPL